MFWGRDALRHAVAAGVALATLLFGGLLPLSGPEAASAASQAAKPNSVAAYGSASNQGPDGSTPFARPPLGIARAGAERTAGYWLASDDGGVHSFGSARFFGSLAGTEPARPVVGIAARPNGDGYWLVADDGGVFAFGAAPFLGSLSGRRLAAPVSGMAATPTGQGYWLVGRDGAVFPFGDAAHHGAPTSPPNGAVVGIAASPTGQGYWLAADDGGVFAYGDAAFLGAMNAGALPAPVSAIAAPPSGGGYWLLGRDGQVYAFGLPDQGSPAEGGPVEGTAVGLAASAGDGYWVVLGEPLITEKGEAGPEVRALQRRLTELGYFVGPQLSGTFDNNTVQAVYAFQKVEGLPATGKVDAATRQRLATAGRPKPASAVGDLVEIDKSRQILMIVRGGQVQFVFNTSTATEQPYTYKGRKRMAHTPEGRFAIFREIDGYRESHLGRLYRPKYFHPNGIAFHGSAFVPPYPASHGCVRLSNAAINFIWDQKLAPRGSAVWVYGVSPPGKPG